MDSRASQFFGDVMLVTSTLSPLRIRGPLWLQHV